MSNLRLGQCRGEQTVALVACLLPEVYWNTAVPIHCYLAVAPFILKLQGGVIATEIL